MSNIYKALYHIFGSIYVPDILKNSEALVHISDTPSFIYKAILNMVKKIKPNILIHTGDIADDIKLELRPQLIDAYKKEANRFINCLSKYANEIILVPGNHDQLSKLELKENVKVFKEGEIFFYNNLKIGLAHKYENLPCECDIYLFGHDKMVVDDTYLNGVYYINVINQNGDIDKLFYPIGTDNYRLRINRMSK